MHACTHARMHACTHARMHACTHARMHACTHALTHAHTHARTHAHTHTHDGRRQSYIVLFSLMLSHDHRTMIAAHRTISRGRSQIVADYRTMVVRWSCNNRRLAYDLDSKILRSLKTCRKAIVVCDCSYDCGKNHCNCPRSLPVVGGRRS